MFKTQNGHRRLMHHTSLVLKGEVWMALSSTNRCWATFIQCLYYLLQSTCLLGLQCMQNISCFLRDSNRDTAFADNSFVNSVFYGEP
uniref:Uncharacterized protein n=2 Tax=Anguilla anguilla TaxID=7936 RepID=A0A0E9T339_ANGAN